MKGQYIWPWAYKDVEVYVAAALEHKRRFAGIGAETATGLAFGW